MTELLKAVEYRKETLIQQLISFGVYKKESQQLYELTLSEIETEYRNQIKTKQLSSES
ncbi:Fur-regulated basic protein FbpA [Niallia nealsonii]|uniref:Fur-regulated basic protein FbpA n=1 Tax=Niallia nealsonii TaxID=115979 RepID=A0A2N0Z1D2_9BACI|nr:Fur-regulated basic protein FbpA [Niallia nealsonii]PKG23315.1 Fur-regulated basic protein FbpA [Niallia nealsonii]